MTFQEKLRERAEHIAEDSIHMSTVHIKNEIEQALIATRNEALEECAEIVDRQLDINSETGGDEELTTARNLILALKTGERK